MLEIENKKKGCVKTMIIGNRIYVGIDETECKDYFVEDLRRKHLKKNTEIMDEPDDELNTTCRTFRSKVCVEV